MELSKITYKGLEEGLKNKPAVIIPVGAMEWHDEHLPIGLDYLKVYEISKLIAEKVKCFVTPPISFGYPKRMSRDPLKGLGTFCPDLDALQNYIFSIGKIFVDKNFKLIYFLSGHYERSQIFMLKLISRRLVDYARDMGKEILSVAHLEPDFTIKDGISMNAREDHVRTDLNPIYHNGDHAGIFETSIALYLTPNLVQMDKFKDEYNDKKLGAPTAELGKRWVEMIVSKASNEINELLNEIY